MATRGRKPAAPKVTEEELKEANVRPDYLSDRRSSDGYIRIRVNENGAAMMRRAADRQIEERQEELERLREQKKKFEKIEEKLGKKSKKDKKKDKKKKKKDKKMMKKVPESSRILFGAIEEYKEKYHKSKKDKKKEKEEFEGVTTKVKGAKAPAKPKDEEAEKKKKEEAEKREFEKKFDEPLTLLRQTVVEYDKTLDEVNNLFGETKNSHARNRNVLLKDLLSSKATLLSGRVSAANAMSGIQKVKLEQYDKQRKSEAQKGDERNQNINLLARAFPQLIAGGSKFNVKSSDDDDDDKKDKKKDKGKDDGKKKKRKSNDYEEQFMSRAKSLINSGELEFTPHEASIEMEGKYRVAVKKSFKTEDWIFIALDNNGMEIRDFKEKYPGLLPKKKNHELRFDDDKDVAKCKRTDQVFQVIQVPYI